MNALDQLQKREGTALVLSGGATKSFYFHLGVLKALHLHDINAIVGSSAGAVMGALIASGISVENIAKVIFKDRMFLPEINQWVRTFTSTMLFKPRYGSLVRQGAYTGYIGARLLASLPSMMRRDLLAEVLDSLVNSQTQVSSFFSTSALEDMLRGILPSTDFNDMKIDLYVVATDLDNTRRAIFNKRYNMVDEDNQFISDVPVHRAVRASVAVPGLFEPIKINGRYYIDGEIKRTLSADIGMHLADTVIISHTYQPLQRPGRRTVKELGWWNIMTQAGYIIFYERIRVWQKIYREMYPEKKMICIAPDPDDEVFFRAPQFSFRPEVQKALIHSGEMAAQHALAQLAN